MFVKVFLLVWCAVMAAGAVASYRDKEGAWPFGAALCALGIVGLAGAIPAAYPLWTALVLAGWQTISRVRAARPALEIGLNAAIALVAAIALGSR